MKYSGNRSHPQTNKAPLGLIYNVACRHWMCSSLQVSILRDIKVCMHRLILYSITQELFFIDKNSWIWLWWRYIKKYKDIVQRLQKHAIALLPRGIFPVELKLYIISGTWIRTQAKSVLWGWTHTHIHVYNVYTYIYAYIYIYMYEIYVYYWNKK